MVGGRFRMLGTGANIFRWVAFWMLFSVIFSAHNVLIGWGVSNFDYF